MSIILAAELCGKRAYNADYYREQSGKEGKQIGKQYLL